MRSILAMTLIITLGACSKPPERSLGDDVPDETARDTPPPVQIEPAAQPTTRPAATQPAGLGSGLPGRIAAAHGVTAWRTKDALAATIRVDYMGKSVLSGEMIYEPRTERTRMELDTGVTMIWDGKQAWAFPASRAVAGQVRFHLRSWPFLMAAPFKFIDPGTRFDPREVRPMLYQECETGVITFDPGVGDTSEDWYHIYAQPQTDRLLGMGYLVTYNTESKTRAEAEENRHTNTHSLIFENFEEVDGVVLPVHWRIHRWHRGRPAGDRLGEVILENLRFLTPAPDTFEVPDGAMPDPISRLPYAAKTEPKPRARPDAGPPAAPQ